MMQVENSGGVRNFFKESVIGTTNGAMGLLELTGESIKNAGDEMQASVKVRPARRCLGGARPLPTAWQACAPVLL